MTKAKAKTTAPAEELEVTIEVEELEGEETFSAKEVAAKLGIDAKSLRRWLRKNSTEKPGKGGRWIFNADQVEATLAAFRKEISDEIDSSPDAEDDTFLAEAEEIDFEL